jgi:hypothetical protein
MVNLFLTLTLINIYRFYHTGSKRHIYWSFMFGALGVLTKGAIAIFLPLAVSCVFFGMKKKWKELLLLIFNPVGLTVFGLIVIPWYIGEFMLHGEAFLSDLLMFAPPAGNSYTLIGSTLPYYAYPVLLLIGLLPFSVMFIKFIFQLRKQMSDDLIKYLLIWFVIGFSLLPFAQPKSIFSLVYCLPPLFIIMARAAESCRHSISIFIGPLLIIFILLLIPYMAPFIAGSIENELVRNTITDGMVHFDASYRVILIAVILLLALLPFIKPIPTSAQYAVLGLLFVSMINFLILPIMGSIIQQPVKSAGLLTNKENSAVVTWRINHPSFNLYAQRLTEVRAPRTGDIVFTRYEYLQNAVKYKTLYEKQGFALVKVLDIAAEK